MYLKPSLKFRLLIPDGVYCITHELWRRTIDVYHFDEFQSAEYMRQQCRILYYHLRVLRPDDPVTYDVISDFLDLTKSNAAYHEKKYIIPPKQNWRPKCLNHEEIIELSCYLDHCYYNEQGSPTYDDILMFIRE